MRETAVLVEEQTPQVLFVYDHAGLVINKFSLGMIYSVGDREGFGVTIKYSLGLSRQMVHVTVEGANAAAQPERRRDNLY